MRSKGAWDLKRGSLRTQKSFKAKEKLNGGGRGGWKKYTYLQAMRNASHRKLKLVSHACPPKPCQEGEIKDWGRGGKQRWEAAVAGTVSNNQWHGLRFPSLRTLSDVERDGKTSALWLMELMPALCKPSGWVMSQLSLQIPGQRRTVSWHFGCGYRPSSSFPVKTAERRVAKTIQKMLCASVVPCRRAGRGQGGPQEGQTHCTAGEAMSCGHSRGSAE